MKRRLIALVLALCVIAGVRFGAPAALAESGRAYVCVKLLRIYESASSSSKCLGVAGYGEDLICVAVSGSWAKVQNGAGATGFCKRGGLDAANPNTLNAVARVKTDGAPVYRVPDASAPVWARLSKNQRFSAVAMTKDNAWVRLRSGKNYAYVRAKHLASLTITAAGTAKSAASAAARKGKVYAASTSLAIYARASDSSDVLGHAYYGQSLTCLLVSGEWAKVKSGSGQVGHCKAAKLTSENPNKLSAKVKIVASAAPVYKRPSTSAPVWTTLPKGASFTAVAVTPDGKWTRLKNGDKYAYILSKHVSSPASTTKPGASDGKVYVASNTLTIRKSASASAKALDTLAYGQRLTLLSASDGWAKVKRAGVTGYCKSGSLTTENPNTYSQTVRIKSDGTPVYRLPKSGAAVWTTLKKNASFKAVAITADGKWFRLKNGSNYGYVRSSQVIAGKGDVDGGEQAVYVTALSATLYAKASESAKSVGKAYLGQKLALIGASDGWSKVKTSGGTTGYCPSARLSAKNPNTLNRPYYAKSKNVSLYAKPSTKAKVLDTVKQNASLMAVCLSPNEKWARVVRSDGSFAYVPMSELSAKKIADGSLITDIDPQKVYVVPTTITVYSSASTGSASLGTMSFGESMTCTGKSDTWARVVNSVGTVGYCNLKSVTGKNPNTLSTALYAQADGVKVYKKPKTSSSVLATMSLNGKVTAVAVSEDKAWYRLKSGSAYGYAQAKYFAKSKAKDDVVSGTAGKVISLAKKQLGVPYVYAGQSPSGFDCSGLVYYVFKNAAGVTLRRTAYTQGYDNSYKKITGTSNLKVGDVLFFNTVSDDDACDHAGIYLGGNEFIHASSGGGKVMISSLGTNDKSYYYRTYSWARRILS